MQARGPNRPARPPQVPVEDHVGISTQSGTCVGTCWVLVGFSQWKHQSRASPSGSRDAWQFSSNPNLVVLAWYMLCAATVALNAAERRRRQPLIGRAAAARSAKRRFWEPACLGDKDLLLAHKGKTLLIQFEVWSCCLGLVYALCCHCCTECD